LKIKIIAKDTFRVAAVMDGDLCEAELFLESGEKATKASRVGISVLLMRVAQDGLIGLPSDLFHYVHKEEKIYEFIKGRLRLLCFKGDGEELVVCTSGVMKKSQKVDNAAVEEAIRWKRNYFDSKRDRTLTVVEEELDDEAE